MRLPFRLELWLSAAAVVITFAPRGNKADSAVVADYAEECQNEGCSQEEVHELYNSYHEECINEGCGQEEIDELAGPGAQNAMMAAFLKYQWYIRSQDISTNYLPSNAAWLYSGANYTGLLFQVWGSTNQSVPDLSAVGFNDMTAALRIGSDAYLATYNNTNYSSAQLVVSKNQASLGSPFLNAISSARVSLISNPFATPTPNVQTAVANVETRVGAPAIIGAQASRADAGIDNTFVVQLDVGGEGPTSCHNVVSGFAQSMNLNDVTNNTTCGGSNPPPIPNLIYLQPWPTNPRYPFVNGFADYITMQGAPLTPTNVAEITRVLRVGGSVALWIDLSYNQSAIIQLATNLNSTPQYNVYDEFNGQAGNPKTLIVDGR